MPKHQSRQSGFTAIWSLWRHCLCRFGYYPLLTSPFVVIGCLLSLYSTADCQFFQVDIGFQPGNEAWNATPQVLSGLWYYQSGEEYDLPWNRTYVPGCREYTTSFEEYFMNDDGVWKIARLASLVGGLASLLAVLIIVLFSICPIPACFIWPGILLPSVLVAMCAEGAKFVVFDSDICKSRMWIPAGTGFFSPKVASSCTLQRGAFVSFAAIGVFFLCIILICFRSPEKRKLDPNYGDGSKKSKDQETYLDLERQDTLVLSDRDEQEPQRNDVEVADTNSAETPQITNKHSGRDNGAGDGELETPRLGNKKESQPKKGDIKDSHIPYSFKKEGNSAWVEFARSESSESQNGALFALKNKREQDMKAIEQTDSRRMSILQRKNIPTKDEMALVVFNPKQQNDDQYSNYSIALSSNNGDDTYSTYSVGNNGDDTFSAYSVPVDVTSVDMTPEADRTGLAHYLERDQEENEEEEEAQSTIVAESVVAESVVAESVIAESVLCESVISEGVKMNSPTFSERLAEHEEQQGQDFSTPRRKMLPKRDDSETRGSAVKHNTPIRVFRVY